MPENQPAQRMAGATLASQLAGPTHRANLASWANLKHWTHSEHRTHSALRAGLVTLALASCGGAVQLERTAGVPRYKALPYKMAVQQAEVPEALPQPVVVVGVLRMDSRHGEADRPAVVKQLSSQASLAGCDALVGLKVEVEEKKSSKTVDQLGEGGKTVKVKQEVVTKVAHWQALCVRTAAMGVDPAAPQPADVAPRPATPDVPDSPPPPPETPADPKDQPDSADSSATKILAEALLKRPAFVRAWRDRLEVAHPKPADALDALGEVVVQVTGPTGLWRKTMPQEWFGCKDTPDSAACTKLGEIDKDLRRADHLQEQVAAAPKGTAGSWLRRHQDELLTYLGTYVPTEPSLSSIQSTPYYMGKMAGVSP